MSTKPKSQGRKGLNFTVGACLPFLIGRRLGWGLQGSFCKTIMAEYQTLLSPPLSIHHWMATSCSPARHWVSKMENITWVCEESSFPEPDNLLEGQQGQLNSLVWAVQVGWGIWLWFPLISISLYSETASPGEIDSLKLWTKHSAGKLVQTLLTEQRLLVSWHGREHTQHYFCLCNLVNDISVLLRTQLRNQCSCYKKTCSELLQRFKTDVHVHTSDYTH